MGYSNIFQKLDQDLTSQLQTLQAQQKELLEKKKKLSDTQEKIQNFLDSAQEVKDIIGAEPELMKSIRSELGKIFTVNSNGNSPKLPIKKTETESVVEEKETGGESPMDADLNLEDLNIGEESPIADFNFVDADGKNTSISS